MTTAFIVDYLRSPFTPAHRGALAGVRPDDLAASVIAALVRRSGLDPALLEDVNLGCAFPEGEQGLNIARCAALTAGLPLSVGASSVNRWCGSSLQAVQMAAGAIAMGAGEAFIAGGVESMSRVPMMGFNPLPNPAWDDSLRTALLNMGLTAENLASRYSIGRAEQDAYALESQRKALAARAEGRLSAEITPIDGVTEDGCPRATDADKLAGLKTVFKAEGSVTAGNASPLTDGASATLVCSGDFVRRHHLQPLARVAGYAISGCAPDIMGIGPVEATRKALARAGISAQQLDVIEMNEAFAVQVLACCKDLDLDPARLNRDGGAIALGHPLGATGARLVGKAASLLHRDGGRYALATQCIGGGQGIAMVLEAA
ncbi:acetyl-CoA acetyltransferase [Bordetella sp. J329]|jgi:acetyl-CoA acyltransferase|uniref:thiolase family protein n=1 Tax=Kerstersia gyiorum TaxID=206506 RepID=UPI000FD7C407|nr:thiolase family protein [Kerstersia gyiorum]AZV94323.1 acetyl-CoA acetyltransferase [Bordetella sp. J329]MCH4272871.1 thiolase family protein [Kerstersia gyiorum]MCI1229130.1 thiolase family protein [Kerstersia gyiorum]